MDKLGDDIRDIIGIDRYNVIKHGVHNSPPPCSITNQILDLIKDAGYINLSEWLNEEAEGWVIRSECPNAIDQDCLANIGRLALDGAGCDNYNALRQDCETGYCIERPATRAEALANKATWVGEG